MAVTTGTVYSVETIKANDRDPVQWAVVYFTMSGTYNQTDNSSLVGVAALIQASRRNGKTVTIGSSDMLSMWQPARKVSNPALYMGLKTISLSGADVLFEITEGATAGVVDFATELAAAAIPAQATPFGLLVGFTEA